MSTTNDPSSALNDIAAYYSGRLAVHGQTAQGVDWNGSDSQLLRFGQLLRVVQQTDDFSLHDLGCGYGAFWDRLAASHHNFRYHGFDISGEMIAAARRRIGDHPGVQLTVGATPTETADYSVASGIFNVRLQHPDQNWHEHIISTLNVLNATSRLGFSFNCLTSYSDAEHKRDYLYYADPARLFDHCKRHYSSQVALLHDYGLYEFTLIVRR